MDRLETFYQRHIEASLSKNPKDLYLKTGALSFVEQVDSVYAQLFTNIKPSQHIFQIIEPIHQARGEVYILDAGAGESQLLRDLGNKFPKTVAGVAIGLADPRPPMVQEADTAANITYVVRPIEQVTFEPNSFDFIFCQWLLPHDPHPLQTITKLYSFLKPRGELYCLWDGKGSSSHIRWGKHSFADVLREWEARAVPILSTTLEDGNISMIFRKNDPDQVLPDNFYQQADISIKPLTDPDGEDPDRIIIRSEYTLFSRFMVRRNT